MYFFQFVWSSEAVFNCASAHVYVEQEVASSVLTMTNLDKPLKMYDGDSINENSFERNLIIWAKN